MVELVEYLIAFAINATLAVAAVIVFLHAGIPIIHSLSQGNNVTDIHGGVIVPLYSYPDWSWDRMIGEQSAYPKVPVIAIINPANGPGFNEDPNYAAGVRRLTDAGIRVVGYVPTGWGGKGTTSLSEVENEILSYQSFYGQAGIRGVFLDQMATDDGSANFYAMLCSYAKSIGLPLVVGNPGTYLDPAYDSIGLSVVVVYEDAGTADFAFLSSSTTHHYATAMIAYGEAGLDSSYVQVASRYLNFIWITSGVIPDPYTDVIPPYIDRMFSWLAVGSAN